MTEPLLWTWGPRDAVAHGYVKSFLKFRRISAEDFPSFRSETLSASAGTTKRDKSRCGRSRGGRYRGCSGLRDRVLTRQAASVAP